MSVIVVASKKLNRRAMCVVNVSERTRVYHWNTRLKYWCWVRKLGVWDTRWYAVFTWPRVVAAARWYSVN